MKICIDPGHGGRTSGAVGVYSIEKNITLEIALKLKKVLERLGMDVVMTRESDEYVSLQKRCDIANNSKCDYFLSIHCDGFSDSSASGTSTHYYSGSTKGKAFASAIQSAAVAFNKNKDRGIKTASFYVLKYTSMPAALLETAFITNRKEEDMLNNKEWQDGFTEALGKAIAKYFGVDSPDNNNSTGETVYRVFKDDVQKGAFRVKDNAVRFAGNLLSDMKSGNVKITVSPK